MPYPYLQEPLPDQRRAMKKLHKVKNLLVRGDMGTGKTKIAVDFIANMVWHKKISRAIVVVPSEALGVWIAQIEDNCPFLLYSLLLKGETCDWDVNLILTTYDHICPRRKRKKPTQRAIKMAEKAGRKLKKRYFIDKHVVESIIRWKPEVAVIDEGHKIKRPTARRSKAVHLLGAIAEYTIDLTGTPTGNKKVLDLWSQFKFLKPDLLEEDFADFKQHYAVWGGFGGFQFLRHKNLKHLQKLIAPHSIVIRSVGLPEQNFIRYPVIMPPEAKDIYRQMEEEFVAYVQGQNVVASIVITKMMKLSQIAGGHIKNEAKENLPVHRAKLDAITNILDELLEQGQQRVVIFARFIWELDEIRKILDEQGWNTHRIKGKVPKEAMDRFNDEGGAMLCQTASGSGSNNLQAANYCIFYSTDYSLINYLQAIKRIHRLGQTKVCHYYFLQSKGTIDIRIYNLLKENKNAAEEITALMEGITDDNRRRSGRSW